MSLLNLALRNVAGSPYRSSVIALCVCLAASLSLFGALVIRGSERSLHLAQERLGADVLVLPKGVEDKVETALLMGRPAKVWMPSAHLAVVAGLPGVAAASPQVFLASLSNASCCAFAEMFIVAYDSASDFTLRPWLEQELGRPLALGEAIGGAFVFSPDGDGSVTLYGCRLALRGNLEATGSGLDQTLFITADTAREMARLSYSLAERPLELPQDRISAVLVRLEPGADAQAVAQTIRQALPDVSALASPQLFQSHRRQLAALARGFVAALAAVWTLAVVAGALLFALAAHERRRQVGVLRALGAARGLVVRWLLAEAGLLALAGAVPGMAVASLTAYLFRDLIVATLNVPVLLPPPGEFVGLAASGLVLAVAGMALAAALPALWVSRQEPAVAMR